MPQGSYKKSKCDVPKQKDKHRKQAPGLKKGGNLSSPLPRLETAMVRTNPYP